MSLLPTTMNPKEIKEKGEARKKSTIESLSIEMREHVETVPKAYQYVYAKALAGGPGLRGAVKAKCMDCVAFEGIPNEIRDCPVTRCPLWAYRPYQPKTTDLSTEALD